MAAGGRTVASPASTGQGPKEKASREARRTNQQKQIYRFARGLSRTKSRRKLRWLPQGSWGAACCAPTKERAWLSRGKRVAWRERCAASSLSRKRQLPGQEFGGEQGEQPSRGWQRAS